MRIKNYLLGYRDMYIMQDTDMFNFSLDSILLPNFVTINKNISKILDIGCGNAPIPLILSTKTNAKITGVEIQKQVYDLAVESVEINHLSSQISIVNEDINNLYKTLATETFDMITCNPPYFKIQGGSNMNESDYKKIARHETKLTLEEVMKVSKKLLKNNGILAMVHRPERLIEIIELMRSYNIEPKKIRLVYPKKNSDANILLIEGSKNGRPGLKVLPPLYSHNEDGSYTDDVMQYFG